MSVMNRFALSVAAPATLLLSLVAPGRSLAQEGRSCIPEPTDMTVAGDDVVTCAIDTTGDTDTFRFPGQSGDMISIQVTRQSGGEPQIELFDPGGTRVAGPVASGPFSQFARIDFRLTTAGLHSIRVSDWGSDAVMGYVLVINRTNGPTSTVIPYNSRVSGDISPQGDVDLYSFQGSADEKVIIQLTRQSGGEAEMELLDATGARIAGSVNSGPFSQFARLDYKLPASGFYTVRVTDWGSDARMTFMLALDRIAPAPVNGVSITFGAGIAGDINPKGDSDYYTFSANAGARVTIQSTRLTGGEPELELYDSLGVRVAGPVNSGPFSQFALIDITLPATGTFSIRATDWGSDAPMTYRLEVQCFGNCTQSAPPRKGRFLPVTPCRVADTRLASGPFGGPVLAAGESRTFAIPAGPCQTPSNAVAYAFNVTVVPVEPLAFLSLWPTGQSRPLVSTLNSFDGSVAANAAVVPAGTGGAVNVYATNQTHVILDISGYFIDPSAAPQALAFFPVTPCRVADTRGPDGPLGGPTLAEGQSRDFPVRGSSCGIPATAQAYSLNITAVPSTPLAFLTAWPSGLGRPFVSTLNSFQGTVVANAAIVPAGSNGSVSIFVTNRSDVVIDINGYFAPPAAGGLQFVAATPCRISDTRNPVGPFGGPTLGAGAIRDVNPALSACGIPANAEAYSANVTVVPTEPLAFLTLWPAGQTRPGVSTLNSWLGKIVANAAITPRGSNGALSIYVTNSTEVILDVNGYFAP